MGISIDGEVASGFAGAGVSFNLPKLSATITQVADVDSKCEPLNTTSKTANAILDDIFGSLTHIAPEIDFDVALLAELNVGVMGAKNFDERAAFTAWSTAYPLPTACLSFDREATTFGAPIKAAATTTPGAGKPGPKTGAAAVAIENPLSLMGWGRMEVVVGLMLGLLACFSAL